MSISELEQLYSTNDRFMEYVDKYCFKHNLTLKVAFSHKMVQEYAISIMPGGVNYKNDKPRTM